MFNVALVWFDKNDEFDELYNQQDIVNGYQRLLFDD